MQKRDFGTIPPRTASERLLLMALGSNPNSTLAELQHITGSAPRQTQLCVRTLRFGGLITISTYGACDRENRFSLISPK